MSVSSTSVHEWPGKRLGLPDTGPRSVGRIGRRILAILVDWGLAMVISVAFFAYDPIATLVIFAAAQIVFIPLVSGSIGHLVFGLRVVPITGGWVGVWRPIVRTLLLCPLIPAVIWDNDQRGLHDIAAGTVLVRR